MNYFLLGTLCFVFVVGIMEILRKIKFWLYKPHSVVYYIGVTINNPDEAEYIVRSMIQRIKWMELGTSVEIIIIDKTKNDEARFIIEKLISKYDNISYI